MTGNFLECSGNSPTSPFGLFRKATISMDFDPFLTQLCTHFGLVLAPFWLHFGPPSGGHFERKHKENQRFSLFWSSKKAYFWSSFWLHFGSIFGSILDPFSGALWARPKPLILHSLQACQARLGGWS